jgi:tetratricopeptide (TPR) repeat protein
MDGQEAMYSYEQCIGRDHASYATAANNLALVYRQLNDNEKASSLFEEVLAIRRRILPHDVTNHSSFIHHISCHSHTKINRILQ